VPHDPRLDADTVMIAGTCGGTHVDAPLEIFLRIVE
jgi:hypothetical protein